MTTVVGFVVLAGTGAVARWWALGHGHGKFPWPTLLVNVSGAFVLGCLTGADLSAPVFTVLGTAGLGAYTTFSTFTGEAHDLVGAGESPTAAAYVAVSVLAGVTAAATGLALTG